MPEWARQLAQMHSSDGLVRPDLELSCFGGLTPLTKGDGRHEVFRATLPDGRARALKEYPAAQYNVLLKEARLLRKLRHPYIVEVRRNHPTARHGSSGGGVQVESVVWNRDNHKVYLVLPLCDGGSLAEIMRALRPSDELRCRTLVRQVRAAAAR
jgi:serine/threonine protein kinase